MKIILCDDILMEVSMHLIFRFSIWSSSRGRFNCLQLVFMQLFHSDFSRSADWISRFYNNYVTESLTKSSSLNLLLFVSLNFLIFLVFLFISNIDTQLDSFAHKRSQLRSRRWNDWNKKCEEEIKFKCKDTFGGSVHEFMTRSIEHTNLWSDIVTTSFSTFQIVKCEN